MLKPPSSDPGAQLGVLFPGGFAEKKVPGWSSRRECSSANLTGADLAVAPRGLYFARLLEACAQQLTQLRA